MEELTNGKKIKDIYMCRPIESVEELYPLQEWYNQLINKKFLR